MTQQVYNYIQGIFRPPIIYNIRLTFADDRVLELLTTLTPLEPLKQHQDVKLPRTKNTGIWFPRLESFCQWRDNNSMELSDYVFCCYGIPGAGKTVIWY